MPPLFPEGLANPGAKRIGSRQNQGQTWVNSPMLGGDPRSRFQKQRRGMANELTDCLDAAEDRGGRDRAARKRGARGQVKPLPDGFRRTRQ